MFMSPLFLCPNSCAIVSCGGEAQLIGYILLSPFLHSSYYTVSVCMSV